MLVALFLLAMTVQSYTTTKKQNKTKKCRLTNTQQNKNFTLVLRDENYLPHLVPLWSSQHGSTDCICFIRCLHHKIFLRYNLREFYYVCVVL